MNPEMFNIFGISFRWYSILILIGVLISFLISIKEGKKKGYRKELIFDLGFYVVLFGIIGARIYYVIFNFNLYKNNLIEILEIYNGGLAIHGGIIAGLITTFIFCKKKKIKLLDMTDIIVYPLLLAQAIGRWGNFFNSEAHGPVTSLENLKNIKIIPKFVIDGMNIDGIYYHPTFYYESLWCLGGFIILFLIKKFFKYIKVGQLTCIYLLWYGIGRLFIESLRTDSLMLGNIKIAQLMSILFIILGLFGFIYLFFSKEKTDEN